MTVKKDLHHLHRLGFLMKCKWIHLNVIIQAVRYQNLITTYQYEKVPWSWHSILAGEDSLYVPSHQAVEYGVQQQEPKNLSQ